MLTSRQIRQQYIEFFVKKHGHAFVASSPVVPHEDPTLLFTNAGMNQFKPYFLGAEKAPWTRVANTQKCIRAGGKHNDLDDVGRSRRHHTFFEMLGNWSFGNYFKEGAIAMAWELLTKEWGLDPSRLHVSCYEGDEKNGIPRDTEAAEIWKRLCGVADDHIHFFGKDNFWEMGDTGPCGPCTEIYIDRTPDKSGGPQVNGSDPRVMEIWNLVFIQYNRDSSGKLTPLPAQHVDTGMGFERISQVLQGADSNYGIDLWVPFFDKISELSGKRYTGLFPPTNSVDPVAEAANPQLRTDIAFRVIADHIRCLTFAITDGATPSNEGRGYVLRRIIRRAYRFGRQQLGMHEPFLYKLVQTVVESMGDAFPELNKDPGRVAAIIKDEEESFGKTIERGITLFEEAAVVAAVNAGKATPPAQPVISGADAFKLHDTYGFPIDLTEVMAAERGYLVDFAGYVKLMEQAKELARSGGSTALDPTESLGDLVQKEKLAPTDFIGYKTTEFGEVTSHLKFYGVVDGKYQPVASAPVGTQVAIVLDLTPFYAESGGQVGDTGVLQFGRIARVEVENTLKFSDVYFHIGKVVAGTLMPVETTLVATAVDRERRERIMCNHTTTHIMNRALRRLVNPEADQKGSLVDADKLRFDFSQNSALTHDQILGVESMVNQDIAEDLPVFTDFAPQEQALKIRGLRAVFGEKYPPNVRIVSIGAPVKNLLEQPDNEKWANLSIEFCGGTHLPSTGRAEQFVIVGEEAVAKGIRRITAMTGSAAHRASHSGSAVMKKLSHLVGRTPEEISIGLKEVNETLEKVTLPVSSRSTVRDQISELQKVLKELDKQKTKEAAGAAMDVVRKIAEETTGQLIISQIPGADANALRSALDVIKKKRPDAAALLGGVSGEGADAKVAFIALVPHALIEKGLKAGDWVKEVAKAAGGSGGGKPDVAQAGAKDPSKLAEALDVGRKFAAGKL